MTAIVPSDVLFKLSAPNANSGNVVAGYPGTSWGGWLSTTILPVAALDNLFNDITGAQNAAGQVDYACLFIQNNTASTNSMGTVIAFLPTSGVTGAGSTTAIASDPTGVTSVNSSTPQALKIASSIVAPAGINTWIGPTAITPTPPNYIGGVQLGTIAPGQCAALWFQRTAIPSTAPSLTTIQLEIIFNTGS